MWARTNLQGLGDAQLAASCVNSPGQYNPARAICSGIVFADVATALTWPGAAISYPGPSVNSVLASPEFPVSFPLWGMAKGDSGRTGGGDVSSPAPGANLTPTTLVAPMPSITPIDPSGTMTDQAGGVMCQINSMAARNPVAAVAAAAVLYWLLKGSK